jgi:methyl-accepting chemotaxis protein
MKLGTKIILGFLTICAIFILVGALVIFVLMDVNKETHNLRDNIMPSNSAISELQFFIAMDALYVLEYHDFKNKSAWDNVLDYSGRVEKNINDLKGFTQKGIFDRLPTTKQQSNKTEELYNVFKQSVLALYKITATIEESRAKLSDAQSKFYTHVQNLRASLVDKMHQSIKNHDTAEVITAQYSLVEGAFDLETDAANVLVAMYRAIDTYDASHFDKAIALLNEAITEVNAIINYPGSLDYKPALLEIIEDANQCQKALKIMRDSLTLSLEETAKRMKARDILLASVGELEKAMNQSTMDFASEAVTSLEKAILIMIVGVSLALALSVILALFLTRGVTKPINLIISALSEGANEVDTASRELSVSSNTLAEGATENAASLEETSAALEQLSSMTKRNSDNAVEANSLMSQTTEAVTKAEESMSNVIQAMNHIAYSGNEISKIIKTIDEIAFQTNLLALNAAVEAARAGEAGAGFAVVADEVRNLAIRSAEAAKNTADLIATTISNIKSGSDMVNSTHENFLTVSGTSAKVAQLVSEVAEASKEQSLGINQISLAMSQMDKVTQSNAASSEEAASSASNLSNQADKLADEIKKISFIVYGASAANGLDHSQVATSHLERTENGEGKS